jgi:hypothetical protein
LNVFGDDICDDAIGFSSDTGRYHTSTTFIEPQYVDASHGTFNNVRGNQSNVVNVAVNNTVVFDSPSLSLYLNHKFLQSRLLSRGQTRSDPSMAVSYDPIDKLSSSAQDVSLKHRPVTWINLRFPFAWRSYPELPVLGSS